ncbi:MAG TPA: glycosyltransferase family 2 protein [Myxococcota bacterium]
MRRAILIPAFDEASRLGDVLRALSERAPGFDVIVVDDGSGDATAEVAAAAGARVLRHSFNLGYGAALQTGYKYAWRTGVELLIQLDADGQHDPADATALLEPVERGELDLVIGSRFLGGDTYRMGALRSVGRALFQSLLRAFGLRVTDPTSGFQAMNRAVLELYTADAFPIDYPDVDVLLAAHRQGLRVGERPVTMAQSARPSSLHSGWAPVYYVYKMMLSVWAASAGWKRPPR